MRGRSWMMVGLVGLAGCPEPLPDTGQFRGEDMLDYFPLDRLLDGQWQYLSTDTAAEYRLIGQIANVQLVGDYNRYTLEYRKDCFQEENGCADGDLVRALTWSVQSNQGIHLHDARVGQAELLLDPSIRFTERYMKLDDTVSTDTGGNTYTTTLVEFGDCPVRIPEWNNCAQVRMESSGGPDEVTGTYWLINDFSVVAMEWDGDGARWELSNYVTVE